VTAVTYHRCRQEFGELKSEQMKRAKEQGQETPNGLVQSEVGTLRSNALLPSKSTAEPTGFEE
jgi:hypothetical protein